MIGTLAAARRRTTVPAQLAGVTYTQNAVYSIAVAATYGGMNDNLADGADSQTMSDATYPPVWVKADCGSTKAIAHIIIGYDYTNALGASPALTEGLLVEGSIDDSSWSSITTTPTYASTGSSDGLVQVTIAGNYRYIRLKSPADFYMALLEFQIWGN